MSGFSNTDVVDPTTSSFWKDPQVKKYKADALFLLTAILIVKVILLRAIRHRRAWGFVSFLLLAAGYLTTPAINYVLGLLNDTAVVDRVTVVWAVFLVVLDGAADNTASQSLEENEATRKRFLWDKMLPSIWLFLVIFFTYKIDTFWIPILLLWALFLLKLREKKLALIYACRSRLGLDRVTTIIVEYMKGERDYKSNSHLQENQGSCPIQDYRYLVGVEEALRLVGTSVYPPLHKKKLLPEDLATIDKIWQCEGKLLRSEDTNGHLKDTCLSFALFWRILPVFADHQLPEASRDHNPWKFVRDVLLIKDNKAVTSERVFRVLELELQFLRDYFYTNYFATYCSGVGFLSVRIVVLACYLQVSFITLKKINEMKHAQSPSYWYEISSLQYNITRIIIYVLSVVELVHIVNMVTSRWNKMKWVCSYVQNKWWDSTKKENRKWWESEMLGKVKEWMLCNLCHQPLFKPHLRPWHRKLHQYSLLDSYKNTPFKLRFRWILNGYMELPMIGQKESAPTSLSSHVMEAVLLSIHRDMDGPKLSNGLESLRRNKVDDKLSWACKSEEVTRIILVWHIATSMCEKDRIKASSCIPLSCCGSRPNDPNFRVATSLSKYCAYLVAFVPKLLPDHVYMTQWIFEKAVSDVRTELKPQCCSMFKTIFRFIKKAPITCGQDSCLNKVGVVVVGLEQGNRPSLEEGQSLMEMGLHLAEELKRLEDESVRWKVLADFWVELILFLAPSKYANEHAKHLVKGGEFITHLWALLTHAGIVGRDSLQSK